MERSRDYVIVLPPRRKVGGLWLDGGHDIVIKGGYVTIPTGTPPGTANDAYRTGIYVDGATGTVHIEGVLIDASGGGDSDGIDINAPRAIVQLENLRIVGLHGSYAGFHADLVQPWGGVRALRIDHLTGSSNYQGLFLPRDLGAIGSASLQNIDLWGTATRLATGRHLLWLTSGLQGCSGYRVSLSSVYLQPRRGTTVGEVVWPELGSRLPCAATPARGRVGWSALPVTGSVQGGPPPGGEFVPAGVAGPRYVSPGYAG